MAERGAPPTFNPLDPAPAWDRVATLLVDISEQNGAIKQKLDSVVEEQNRSRDHRTEMYRRMEVLAMTAATVVRIEPLVIAHEQHFQQQIGAGKQLGVIGKIGSVIGGLIGGLLVAAINHFWGTAK